MKNDHSTAVKEAGISAPAVRISKTTISISRSIWSDLGRPPSFGLFGKQGARDLALYALKSDGGAMVQHRNYGKRVFVSQRKDWPELVKGPYVPTYAENCIKLKNASSLPLEGQPTWSGGVIAMVPTKPSDRHHRAQVTSSHLVIPKHHWAFIEEPARVSIEEIDLGTYLVQSASGNFADHFSQSGHAVETKVNWATTRIRLPKELKERVHQGSYEVTELYDYLIPSLKITFQLKRTI